MKALVLKKFGGTENFAVEEVDTPRIKENEVLIKVHAIGINPVDIKTRKGEGMASQYDGKSPIILGWDVSGVLVEADKNVKNFTLGDEVFGTVQFPGRGGAYAEYIAAPADQIAKKPANLPHSEAVAATLPALTAWQALVETGGIKRGDKVLIHGATGGVGSFAVQIARHFGAYIVGTASGEGVQLAKQLGANEVIDYKKQRFETVTGDFDLILDTVGGENFVRSLKVLKPEGILILLPTNKKEEAEKVAQEQHVKHYKHILMHASGKEMQVIARMLKNGSMKVHVAKTFPFAQLPEAHAALERGEIKGKVVVTLE